MPDKIKTAIVTGGHSYDVPGFHDLFRGLPGVDPYIQHMDDFASSTDTVRQQYGCIVFYTMLLETPLDGAEPWYAGNPHKAIQQLGLKNQGLVILHHGLVAYPQWDLWSQIVGKTARKTFGYKFDQSINVAIAQPNHPIVSGLRDWSMVDETYQLSDADAEDALPGNEILLTVDHPESMRTVAWVRQFRDSRVFCLQLGHDSQSWANKQFQEILHRGILWASE